MKLYPEIGELFERRYQIEGLVGTGGFARIYKATQTDLGRTVAIKVITFSEYDDGPVYGEVVEERFHREVRLVSLLNDPNTITMFDFGKSEDGLLYMVMEFVDGVTLAELLPTVGRMEVERTFRILSKIAQSLREAHERDVIHGDIKPNNIMVYEHLDEPDCVKVLDFGIAHLAQTTSFDPAKEPGTPWYMAPEQILGEEQTTRSDLYSLGLVTYELLTGGRAVSGDNVISAISTQLSHSPFAFPDDVIIDASAKDIVLKLIEKDPDKRYESAKALNEDLTVWLDSEAVFDRKETNVYRKAIPIRESNSFKRVRTSDVLLHGRYRPIATLDQNEFGSRLKAEDSFLSRTVVLHVVPTKLEADKKAAFVERAKLFVTTPHANLPLIHDIVGGDDPMLVCEFIEGDALAQTIQREGFDNVRCKEIALQIANALQVIHENNVWHGAINSSGITIASDHIKFQHFGAWFDSPRTISERLIRSAQKTDVFRFGIILAEMLSGRLIHDAVIPEFPINVSKTLKDIVLDCTGPLDSRPEIDEIVTLLNSGRESIVNF